jgi:hypothetical protein
MPHTNLTWKEAIKEDPVWQKAVRGFIRKGFSLKEIEKQHAAWKSKRNAVVTRVMSKSEK